VCFAYFHDRAQTPTGAVKILVTPVNHINKSGKIQTARESIEFLGHTKIIEKYLK
jgi:hypothetical protein